MYTPLCTLTRCFTLSCSALLEVVLPHVHTISSLRSCQRMRRLYEMSVFFYSTLFQDSLPPPISYHIEIGQSLPESVPFGYYTILTAQILLCILNNVASKRLKHRPCEPDRSLRSVRASPYHSPLSVDSSPWGRFSQRPLSLFTKRFPLCASRYTHHPPATVQYRKHAKEPLPLFL